MFCNKEEILRRVTYEYDNTEELGKHLDDMLRQGFIVKHILTKKAVYEKIEISSSKKFYLKIAANKESMDGVYEVVSKREISPDLFEMQLLETWPKDSKIVPNELIVAGQIKECDIHLARVVTPEVFRSILLDEELKTQELRTIQMQYHKLPVWENIGI